MIHAFYSPGNKQPMAEALNKVIENVPGAYYVDDSCIDCDTCRSIAPQFFTRDDDAGYTYVRRQPVTLAELALAEAGRSSCPSDSIGNDGVVAS
ncbi:MAG: putative ferredoxin [Chthoniobacteraceae bacterium]|nr:putative ferredoxin [Chthoniobacteraceae bacterium]